MQQSISNDGAMGEAAIIKFAMWERVFSFTLGIGILYRVFLLT